MALLRAVILFRRTHKDFWKSVSWVWDPMICHPRQKGLGLILCLHPQGFEFETYRWSLSNTSNGRGCMSDHEIYETG